MVADSSLVLGKLMCFLVWIIRNGVLINIDCKTGICTEEAKIGIVGKHVSSICTIRYII